jgi:hypothetical protein
MAARELDPDPRDEMENEKKWASTRTETERADARSVRPDLNVKQIWDTNGLNTDNLSV